MFSIILYMEIVLPKRKQLIEDTPQKNIEKPHLQSHFPV